MRTFREFYTGLLLIMVTVCDKPLLFNILVVTDLRDPSILSIIESAATPLADKTKSTVDVQWVFTDQLQDTSDIIQLISPDANNKYRLMITATESCPVVQSSLLASQMYRVPNLLYTDYKCHHVQDNLPTFTLQSQVNLNTLVDNILETVQNKSQDGIILFYDENTAKLFGDGLQTVHPTSTIHVFATESLLSSSSKLDDWLYKNRRIYRTVVAVISNESLPLIEKARQSEMIGATHNWVIIGLSVNRTHIQSFLHPEDNVVFIPVPNYAKMLKTQFSRNLGELWDLAQNYSNLKSFYLQKQVTMRNVEVFSTDRCEPLRSIGNLSVNGDRIHFPSPLVKLFYGFCGRIFNITTVPNKIFQVLLENGTFTGLAFDILNQLGAVLNFSYVITRPPDGQWGVPGHDGDWNGMVGLVLRREVDFGVASFTMTWQRESVTDFTIPVWEGSNAMVMRTGSGLHRYLVHVRPLSGAVWIAIIATVPAACLSLWFAITRHPLYSEPTHSKDMRQLGGYGYWESVLPCPRVESALFQVLGSLCGQALHWRPKYVSDKLIVGSIWIFSVILLATYTGNLIAALTVQKRTWPVDTLQDLADQTSYTAGLVRGQAMMQVLREASSGVYKKIWQHVSDSDSNSVANLDQGFQKMLQENFIFMDDYKNLVAKVAEEGDCSLHIAKEKFLHTGYGFPLQEGSAYLEEFNKRIQMMIEGGLLQKWIDQYWPKNNCEAENNVIGSANALSLEETAGGFIILLTGILAGITILIIEKHMDKVKPMIQNLIKFLVNSEQDDVKL